MQPFVLLEGIAKGKVTLDIILRSQDEKPEDFETEADESEEDYVAPF